MAGAVQMFMNVSQNDSASQDETSEDDSIPSEPAVPSYTTREQIYANEHTDLTEAEVRRDVKLGLDRSNYDDPSIVQDPDSITVFVNKHWRLPDGYSPQDLVDTDGVRLRQKAADAWQGLKNALQEQGITIQITGGYLSPEESQSLYEQAVSEYGQEQADTVFSQGLFSDSNTGLGLEFTIPDAEDPAADPAYQTVIDEAARHGFIVRYTEAGKDLSQMNAQPLHLRYVGQELSDYLYNHALSFDEYFGTL